MKRAANRNPYAGTGPASSAGRERLAHLALPLAVLALSFSAILVRISESPPQELAALRLLLSAVVLLPWARRRSWGAKAPRSLVLAGLAGAVLGVHYILWFDSLDHTSVASSTLLVTLHPLMVVPLSYFIWGQKTSAMGVIGILLALAGGGLIGRGDLALDIAHLRGDLEAFVSALAMGTYLMIGAGVRRTMDVVPYTVTVYSVGGIAALAFAAFDGFAWPASMHEWWVVWGLVTVPTLIGHNVFNWSLRHISPTTVSVSILGEPVGAVFLAALLFGELPAIWQIVGGLTLLSGIYTFARYGSVGRR